MTATTATATQIAEALTAADGNKSRAAEALGMSVRTFGRRMEAASAEIAEILAQAEAGEPEADTETAADQDGATIAAVAPDGNVVVIAETRHVDITEDAGEATEDEPTEDPAPAQEDTPAKPRTKRPAQATGPAQDAKDAPADFPEGMITPIAFRHYLVREGLAGPALSTQKVYNWVGSKSFPVRHVGADGAVHAVKIPGETRPGVPLTEALAWYAEHHGAK
jgi:hypothetical protein